MTTTATATIKCGNCKATHESVAAVRACYGQPVPAVAPVAPSVPVAKPTKPATEKQVAFLTRLAAERGVAVPVVATTREASAAIEALMAMPKPAPASHPQA
jgi:hypothetical protein